MRKKGKQEKNEELNFWQPASDMFSALLLILMLVILLLGLYLVHIPQYDQPDPWAGNTYAEGSDDEPETTSTASPTMFLWLPDGGGDGGGRETPHPTYPEVTWSPSPSPSPTVSPTPDKPGSGGGGGGGDGGGNGEGEGPGQEPDVGAKSAVYVMLVDAETDRTVKEAGVKFELYGDKDALQILNTYYPERLSFRHYETMESGTFYFPEKLFIGHYELHELTEPEGYDAAENVQFDLLEVFDWSEPLVVKVPIYPSRNVIRVQMNDAETGRAVSGGTFDVIALEDVITADGTLRYRANQIVSEIVCDEDGYGESEEIYLGQYLVRQRDIPEYYAGIDEDLTVSVDKKTNVEPALNVVDNYRTRIRMTLTDELYPARTIADAHFRVTVDGRRSREIEVVTDRNGSIVLDELDKGVTYRIRQLDSAENYNVMRTDQLVTVTARGFIDDAAETTLALTNRMLRVAIGVTDEFSSTQVPNVTLALFDSSDTLVRTWTTTGSALTFNNLQAGSYYLVKYGETESRYDVTVLDTAEVQTINIPTSYILHYIIIGGSGACVLLLVALVIFLVRRRRRKKIQT